MTILIHPGDGYSKQKERGGLVSCHIFHQQTDHHPNLPTTANNNNTNDTTHGGGVSPLILDRRSNLTDSAKPETSATTSPLVFYNSS